MENSHLALHLPALPLEALLRHQPEKRLQPHALLSSGDHRSSTVTHANRAARRHGIHHGLSHTRALARCPTLQFLERSPEAEASTLRDLLRLAESLTPDFELTTPDTLILSQVWSGNHSALPVPRSELEPLGLPVHLAEGDTPDLAHLFSLHPATSHVLIHRGADFRWKPLQRTADFRPLTHLPLSLLQHLEFQISDLELLHQWGLRTLADLARLPRQGITERLGPELARIHDILHGRHQRLLRLFRPAESIESHTNLDYPLSHGNGLVLWLKRALHTLCSRLASSYRSASEIELVLELETPPNHRHHHCLPEPSASPEVLLRPLATHLEHLILPAPVIGFQLHLTPCTSHSGQHELFDSGIRQPHQLADTLVRLAALLGDSQLGFPSPAFTHRPDSFHLAPAHRIFEPYEDRTKKDVISEDLVEFQVQRSTFSLPLSRFRPPIEVSVAFENATKHPLPLALLTGPHRGRITHRHGPFPLSGQWWDPGEKWQQLEWDIRLESRHLLRLAHTPPDLWQLQGAYP